MYFVTFWVFHVKRWINLLSQYCDPYITVFNLQNLEERIRHHLWTLVPLLGQKKVSSVSVLCKTVVSHLSLSLLRDCGLWGVQRRKKKCYIEKQWILLRNFMYQLGWVIVASTKIRIITSMMLWRYVLDVSIMSLQLTLSIADQCWHGLASSSLSKVSWRKIVVFIKTVTWIFYRSFQHASLC